RGYRLPGTGTFFGTETTSPAFGEKGRREEVSEWRLEVVCPEDRVSVAVAAMRRAHSYEEPAFDVYPLRPTKSGPGVGRVGRLPSAMPLADFARTVRTALQSGPVQVVGDAARKVERV